MELGGLFFLTPVQRLHLRRHIDATFHACAPLPARIG